MLHARRHVSGNGAGVGESGGSATESGGVQRRVVESPHDGKSRFLGDRTEKQKKGWFQGRIPDQGACRVAGRKEFEELAEVNFSQRAKEGKGTMRASSLFLCKIVMQHCKYNRIGSLSRQLFAAITAVPSLPLQSRLGKYAL